MPKTRKSVLWLHAVVRYGSLTLAAAAIGCNVNTLYRASAGLGVSEESRGKIESAFGRPLHELQQLMQESGDV
jgi:hypothetical protein